MASTVSSWVDNTNEQEKNLVKEVEALTVSNNGSSQTPSTTTVPAGTTTSTSEDTSQTTSSTGEPVGGGGDAAAPAATAAAPTPTEGEEISVAERSLLQKIIRKGLLDSNKAQLEVKQKDPTSPLYSAHSFEELNLRPELLKGIYAMGFNTPSRIQESALPILLSNPPQNLIAQSQSGTGKTAAFVLAMLSRVDPSLKEPQVLCLSPTYELAVQTGEVINQMGKFCPEITVVFAVRGVEIPYGEKTHSHIIIGTPGKIMDWAFRHKFFDVSKIKVFVLDEADVMIATQGYYDQSIRLHRKLPRDCQKMLFSATYDKEVMRFAESLIPDATIMKLKREEESLDNIKQYYIECKDKDEKYRAIANIYGVITIGQAMIFCQTRNTASWLATKLSKDGHAVALLSGDMTVDQRIAVLNRFRDSQERILITTNVMARGIDVEQVTLVVNYDMPLNVNRQPDFETYLHRIGRTGRFGKAGIAINLVDSSTSMQHLREIEAHFGKPILKLDAENVAELEQLES